MGLSFLKRTWLSVFILSTCCVLMVPCASRADIRITLRNSFIDEYKNRVTIDATYTVDKAHVMPNSPAKDGDLHIAGRAPEVGLPIVAEIMNAQYEQPAVDLVHNFEGTHVSLPMTGVWRIWCEHGGDSEQIQDQPVSEIGTTNPPHVFEIHPITRIKDIDLSLSVALINGYAPKDADAAFSQYERTNSKIVPGKTTTTVVTRMAGYNYVEFVMQLNEDPKLVQDGLMALAAVYDTSGALLVSSRRMVFIKGTMPAQSVAVLHKSDTLHVLGIPRIDLALVAYRVAHAHDKPEVLTWSLPYEMVIVGVYP